MEIDLLHRPRPLIRLHVARCLRFSCILFLEAMHKHFRPGIFCFLLPRMIMCSEESNEHCPSLFIPRPSASTSLRFLKPFRTLPPTLPRHTQTSLQPLNPQHHLQTLPLQMNRRNKRVMLQETSRAKLAMFLELPSCPQVTSLSQICTEKLLMAC